VPIVPSSSSHNNNNASAAAAAAAAANAMAAVVAMNIAKLFTNAAAVVAAKNVSPNTSLPSLTSSFGQNRPQQQQQPTESNVKKEKNKKNIDETESIVSLTSSSSIKSVHSSDDEEEEEEEELKKYETIKKEEIEELIINDDDDDDDDDSFSSSTSSSLSNSVHLIVDETYNNMELSANGIEPTTFTTEIPAPFEVNENTKGSNNNKETNLIDLEAKFIKELVTNNATVTKEIDTKEHQVSTLNVPNEENSIQVNDEQQLVDTTFNENVKDKSDKNSSFQSKWTLDYLDDEKKHRIIRNLKDGKECVRIGEFVRFKEKIIKEQEEVEEEAKSLNTSSNVDYSMIEDDDNNDNENDDGKDVQFDWFCGRVENIRKKDDGTDFFLFLRFFHIG
jgi:hypothetical protein